MSRPEKTQDDYIREVEDRCNDLESRLHRQEVITAVLCRALNWHVWDGVVSLHSLDKAQKPAIDGMTISTRLTDDERKTLEAKS